VFTGIQPVAGSFRNHRAVGASILAHVGLLAAIVFHHPKPIDLTPAWLANGSGTHSYRMIYAPPHVADARDTDARVVLSPSSRAPRQRPKSSSQKPASDHLQLPLDAETADHNSRAGSALGTMIDGPIEGHEVHVAYPVVFPDPRVARAELPRDLQGDVIVEVTIDAQGNVVETKLLQAIGHGIDEKIVAALRQWRYKPATLDGVPVASKHDVHFHFPS
jgi:TonB family protein